MNKIMLMIIDWCLVTFDLTSREGEEEVSATTTLLSGEGFPHASHSWIRKGDGMPCPLNTWRGWTGRQTGRQTDRRVGRQVDRDRQVDRQVGRQVGRQVDRLADR